MSNDKLTLKAFDIEVQNLPACLETTPNTLQNAESLKDDTSPINGETFMEYVSPEVTALFKHWGFHHVAQDIAIGASILTNFDEMHSEIVRLVKIATPRVLRDRGYCHMALSSTGWMDYYPAQFCRKSNKRNYRVLNVTLECPIEFHIFKPNFHACEQKLESLLKGLPAKVQLSVEFYTLRIRLQWNCNVQNLFLSMLGEKLLPEIIAHLQDVIPKASEYKMVPICNSGVGRGLDAPILSLYGHSE